MSKKRRLKADLCDCITAGVSAILPVQLFKFTLSHFQKTIGVFKIVVIVADCQHGFAHVAQLW